MLLFAVNYKNYQMKKIVLLFVSVLTLSLFSTSCSKDDDGEGASIVGKWEQSKEGFLVSGNEALVNYEHTAGCSKDNVEFKANGTAVNTNYYTADCLSESDSSTYTKNGATLTITDADGPYSFIVKELSATTLKIYDTYQDQDSGTTITEVIVFTRVN